MKSHARVVVIGGGVAANRGLRQGFAAACDKKGLKLVVPPPVRCTDNGAMIAYAGCQRLLAGERDDLEIRAQPRWSLESLAAI